jgi:hypothetical protein
VVAEPREAARARGVATDAELPWIAGWVALAALVRWIHWRQTAVMFNDGPVFLKLAEFVYEGRLGEALGHPFHPLYPVAVALAHHVVPDLETAAVTVSVVAGATAVWALHGFVRAAFGRAEAHVAAFFLAVHPAAIEYAGDVQSEGLYLLLFLAAVRWLWPALMERNAGAAAASGALAGAAYLTRPEGLGVPIVGAGWLALGVLRGSWRPAEATRVGVALVLGAALLAGPYLVWLRVDGGAWALTGKKSLGVVAGLEEPPFQGPDPLAANPQRPWVRDSDDPAPGSPEARPPRPEPSLAARLGEALFDTLQTHFRSLRYELAAILLAGLVLWRPRPGPRAAFVGSIVGAYAAVLLLLNVNVGYVSGRHTLPTITLLFGYVATCFVVLVEAVRPGRRRVAVALALGLLVAGVGLGKSLKPSRLEDVPERRAAEWLRAQDLDVRAVAARKRRTAYYAGAPWVKLATAAYPGGLRELGATHLILSDEDAGDYAKLRPLEPPEARRIHRVEAEGHAASVYELFVAPSGGDPARPRSPEIPSPAS